MEFNFKEIEDKWKKVWAKNGTYTVTEDPNTPKYYVLDMFPYPSGAGLHVGHPLGYVASDIYARYKRLKGFNVLHPMGYDAFGLPAEQYAIETGTHPAVTTEKAIKRYKEQLDKIGFSYDWSRQVVTAEPDYYKWTQWIFLKLFGSWYNREANKAELIETLVAKFEANGLSKELAREGVEAFTAEQWKGFSKAKQSQVLMNYRLAFLSYAEVNWCEALGTVLANDEVKDGKSERGGHPVERRKMRQWFLRITEYSDRLLDGLNTLDWSDAMKEMQRNWIGRSEGALIKFDLSQTLSEGEGLNSPRYHTTDSQTWNTSIDFAKEHRSNPTEAEAIVWEQLRAKRTGYKFRRQHPIDQFIADFVCLERGLIVEIDGKIHLEQKENDQLRTEVLNRYGFTVVRFTNEQVFGNIDTVVSKIKETLATMTERVIPSEVDDNELSEGQNSSLPFGEGRGGVSLEVFTTRPDTIFGATFMVIAPEHELVDSLTTPEQKEAVDKYVAYVKSRTDVERQQEKRVTGEFTGSYAVNPFNGTPIPIYMAEYVLAGYGTGAIMAVPADDERDRKFAEKFGLPVIEIIDKSMYPGATIEDKKGKMINSEFLNGLEVVDAIKAVLDEVEKRGIGQRKVNYKQRDAGYSRQRYWGEPFPIKYGPKHVEGFEDLGGAEDIPVPLSEDQLPLVLPEVSSFKPGGDGRSPLANSEAWVKAGYETDTMPGYAGSSWYFLRYMDAKNPNEFAAKDKIDYWKNVDIYFGGAEHAVGHLLYSRMWHKFLHDLGYVPTDEPFQKMVNQGMIQGRSNILYRVSELEKDVVKWFSDLLRKKYKKRIIISEQGNIDISIDDKVVIEIKRFDGYNYRMYQDTFYSRFRHYTSKAALLFFTNNIIRDSKFYINLIDTILKSSLSDGYLFVDTKPQKVAPLYVSNGFKDKFPCSPKHVDINLVHNDILNLKEFKRSSIENRESDFVLYKGKYYCGYEVEKMSKSKYNVVTPDDVIDKYGADCFRMFEMFLGPIEQSKPWDDKGISGTYNFLRKFWRLFYDDKGWKVTDAEPTKEEYKVLHKTIKKIADDIERLNYNTCVSSFMIAVNELTSANCSKRKVLEPLVILLAPFAPFITEELWSALGNTGSVHQAAYPKFEEQYLVESEFEYPISINGKTRAQVKLALDLSEADARAYVLGLESVTKWTNGAEPKKFIYVKGRIINVVV
ncbi:MAG: leucine--tRNA ligase [Bacteroidetes bacterium]|nr:leucine--tRNA ligase [Bacteroidota bacterium]